MSESKFWKEIDKGMGRSWQATRIESHATATGFPDVDYCMKNGAEGKLELKFGYANSMPHIEDSQIRWHIKRFKMGGISFIFSKIKIEGEWNYMLHYGHQIKNLYENSDANYWKHSSFWLCNGDINFGYLKMILRQEIIIP